MTNLSSSPFHAGERAVQERVGVRERMERAGRRMLLASLPDEYAEFLAELPYLIVGSLDEQGRPWASWLNGKAGFVAATGPRSVVVGARPLASDPLAQNLRVGAPLGMLGIELETRRRLRVNGHVAWSSEQGFELGVEQTFGNCRQYIQARSPLTATVVAPALVTTSAEGALLSPRALEILAHSDTAFVATASRFATASGGETSEQAAARGREGVDVSHRGGPAGFVQFGTVSGRTRLTLPDYYGNFMFNTFGNVESYPRAGLLVCDFENGDLLTLTATARVIWSGPRVSEVPGAERLFELDVEAGFLLHGALVRGWSEPRLAPDFERIGAIPNENSRAP
jgi:predicted pyridoxine 5'-phosphate oxidase superfamily flavin-nucleotide-binding protein